MPRHREWSKDQLRRLKAAVEGGVYLSVLAVRFGTSTTTLQDLVKKHGWKLPASNFGPKDSARRALAPVAQPVPRTPPKPKPRRGQTFFLQPNRPAFTPTENGSPVRVLQGAEIQHWKSIYEARDRAQRTKQSVHA